MGSSDTEEKVVVAPPAEAIVTEEKYVAPPPEVPVSKASCTKFSSIADASLRVLLFAASLASVVVMVTSNQTKLLPISPFPPFRLFPVHSKFNYSPAFIYLVAALSVSGLYSIITGLISLYALFKPGCCSKAVFHFVIFDVLLLGIVAAATGTAGAVAYIGLKGNTHAQYAKVCNNFDKFCSHLAGSIAMSLVASIVLVLLTWLNVYSLSKRIPK